MVKKIGILLFILWADFSSAQSWYNVSHSNNPIYSTNSGTTFINNDTLLVSGLIDSTILNGGWSNRVLRFINPINGDKYREVVLPISKEGYFGSVQDLLIHRKSIYLNSSVYESGSYFSCVHKTDIFGNIIWKKYYDSLNFYAINNSIISLNDTTLLICGEKETSFGNLDMRLMWLDTNGNVLNERVYNAPGLQFGTTINQFSNGDLLFGTGTRLINPNTLFTAYRLTSNGDIIWQKNIGGVGASGGFINLLNDSTFLFSGLYGSVTEINRPRVNKYDGNGNLLWSFTYPDFPGIDLQYNSILWAHENSDQSITALAQFKDSVAPFVFYYRAVLMNLSKDGELKWSRKIKLRSRDHYLTSSIQAQNGDNIFTGYFGADSIGQVQDGWLVRANCIGLFEGPEDSLTLSQHFNVVSLNNFANHFAYSTIDWGDGTTPETIESNYSDSLEKITHTHGYMYPGSYTITHKTIACNDTITQTFPITIAFTPASFNQLSLFPNPNNGSFTLALTHEALAQVRIYENNGKIVYEQETDLNGGKQMDFQHLAAGIYLVIVEVDGQKWRLKMVVE
jgi:hypothetical protein